MNISFRSALGRSGRRIHVVLLVACGLLGFAGSCALPVVTGVYERRDSVIFAGIGVAVALCLGLAVTLWNS